jgi:hypothetical protein
MQQKVFLTIFLFILVLSFYNFFKRIIGHFLNSLTVDDKDIIINALFSNNIIPLKNLADLQFNSTVLQKIFGLNDIILRIPGGDIIKFKNVDIFYNREIVGLVNGHTATN